MFDLCFPHEAFFSGFPFAWIAWTGFWFLLTEHMAESDKFWILTSAVRVQARFRQLLQDLAFSVRIQGGFRQHLQDFDFCCPN
ncbi:hypothetical protein QUF73_03095 [Cytobacillus sp. NJ13]|nr:hypothetical protein [Cytobacillus sp. NJ13]